MILFAQPKGKAQTFLVLVVNTRICNTMCTSYTMPKITSSHLLTYANKKGITIKEAREVFDRVYRPTINGWRLRED